jgi:hypothetical protein
MDADMRVRAETRLTEAVAALGLADPRPALRARLKQLREERPDAFADAVRHYEEEVLPRLAEEEPVPAWLDYARHLGQLTANGRLTTIDATGRAVVYRPPLQHAALLLFLPEDTAVTPLVALAPLAPSPAQSATIDLLVNRKLALQDRPATSG